MGRGFRLGRIHGIEIRLDVSVAIIFLLVIYSLGSGLLPQWHADWISTTAWATATAAGMLFFASLLAHELAHSLVAQRYGISVPRITADAMEELHETIRPDARGRDALKLLSKTRQDPIPVLDDGQVVGFLHHSDLMRWLALHETERRRELAGEK